MSTHRRAQWSGEGERCDPIGQTLRTPLAGRTGTQKGRELASTNGNTLSVTSQFSLAGQHHATHPATRSAEWLANWNRVSSIENLPGAAPADLAMNPKLQYFVRKSPPLGSHNSEAMWTLTSVSEECTASIFRVVEQEIYKI